MWNRHNGWNHWGWYGRGTGWGGNYSTYWPGTSGGGTWNYVTNPSYTGMTYNWPQYYNLYANPADAGTSPWPANYYLYNGDLTVPNPDNPAQAKATTPKTPPKQ